MQLYGTVQGKNQQTARRDVHRSSVHRPYVHRPAAHHRATYLHGAVHRLPVEGDHLATKVPEKLRVVVARVDAAARGVNARLLRLVVVDKVLHQWRAAHMRRRKGDGVDQVLLPTARHKQQSLQTPPLSLLPQTPPQTCLWKSRRVAGGLLLRKARHVVAAVVLARHLKSLTKERPVRHGCTRLC